jgi:hypothetical protein
LRFAAQDALGGIGKYAASEDYVLLLRIFRIVMADTGDAGNEEHTRRQVSREDLGVMDRGAWHPHMLAGACCSAASSSVSWNLGSIKCGGVRESTSNSE